MNEETYKQLLDENKKRDEKIKELENKIADVVAFNKALLDSDNVEDKKAINKEKEEQEKERIRKEIFK